MNKFKTYFQYVTKGFEEISSAVNIMFDKFQTALEEITPKLDLEERRQFDDAFSLYYKFLMSTQQFVSITTDRVTYAETLQQLCDAISIDLLQESIIAVESLLKTFRELEGLVRAKFPKDMKLRGFQNFMLGEFYCRYIL